MKKALITGITGQDGSYLAELLLSKGYEVHGIIRRASTFNTHRIDHIYADPHNPEAKLFLHYGDLSDPGLLVEIMLNVKPDEIYHLGAQSHVRVSFDMPEFTGNITGLGTTRVLEAIRRSRINAKFYQASSSEMFGAAGPPQNENTKFYPRSPYGAAKVYSYWMTVNYRESYGMFASNGILFNHESPRRGEIFLTRKITRAAANILAGKQKILYLGNLDAKRDWGFAPDYVEAMWLMLQQDKPGDYVIGTGESYSVREFAELAFKYAGIEMEWQDDGVNEKGVIKAIDDKLQKRKTLKKGQELIKIDERYFRPAEVDFLKADIAKAKKELNWEPRINFDELVKIMVDYDLKLVGEEYPGQGEKLSKTKGFGYTKHDFSFYGKT
ncbi:MAG: GDP-mannose 4,6-dehydratase [Candidatus Omnitrophica bacterium]|nr:GDP-mannose 4,6-dehydratase [Candidatus Omnitrophota bacterium]MBU1127549.1 GDP-mannose 4,6-dehydratase [Candidatus Omnitrophota bacterium]MBU1852385.1 GDP-mannose 4,6-dehydratase [Candidatus Omnitrophota bacterium]